MRGRLAAGALHQHHAGCCASACRPPSRRRRRPPTNTKSLSVRSASIWRERATTRSLSGHVDGSRFIFMRAGDRPDAGLPGRSVRPGSARARLARPNGGQHDELKQPGAGRLRTDAGAGRTPACRARARRRDARPGASSLGHRVLNEMFHEAGLSPERQAVRGRRNSKIASMRFNGPGAPSSCPDPSKAGSRSLTSAMVISSRKLARDRLAGHRSVPTPLVERRAPALKRDLPAGAVLLDHHVSSFRESSCAWPRSPWP